MNYKVRVYPQDESLGYAIHRLDTLLAVTLERSFQAAGFNVTPEQWGVLSKLWEGDGIHQSELSRKVSKDKHTMTRILSLLERNGLVKRVRDENDKRLSNVYLTTKGKELKGKLPPIARTVLQRTIKDVNQEDIDALWRILRQMIANLETG